MKLYRFFTLFVLYIIIKAQTVLSIRCEELNDCSCIPLSPEDYEFHCSGYDASVIIRFKAGDKTVEVQCIHNVNWNTANLPLLDIKQAKYVNFLQCPLPVNDFSKIIHKLGINNTKSIAYEYCPHGQRNILTSDYFKNLHSLEKLSLGQNGIRNIEETAFRFSNELLELDLKFNKIHLKTDLFKYLRKLRLLDISGNELKILPFNLFQHLENLRALYLNSNNFSALNDTMFESLTKLTFLELSNNLIENISLHVFYDLENLKLVSLATNRLRVIPENLFINNKLIEKIFLNRNLNLVKLPNGLFSNLTKLSTVIMSECQLKYLPDDLFHESINLQDISFNMNELEYLPNEIFINLERLENIDLSHNKIKELSTDLFSTTTKIKRINLDNNLLTSIKETYFEHLQTLEVLGLKSNKINQIDLNAFRRNAGLTEVILADNQFDLPTAEPLFSNNLKLKKVNLRNNNITSITDDFRITLISLEELDLSYNKITYLEFNSIFTTARPITIDLSHNNIGTIDFTYAEMMIKVQDMSGINQNNENKIIVKIDENPVACDCRLFKFIQYLEHILDSAVPNVVSIQFNNLTCISPKDLYGHPVTKLKSSTLVCSLEQLGIKDKLTEKCAYSFRSEDETLIVNCTKANFTSMPELLFPKEHFFKKTEVHMQKNQLTEGPKENMGYENVTNLSLSHNKIRTISWIPPKIKVLELNNNSLSHIDDEVLSKLNQTFDVNITLGSNPWKCDCSTKNLTNFILTSTFYRRHIDIYQITCANGRLLANLSANEICKNLKVTIALLGVVYFMIIFGIFLLYAIYYLYRQDVNVWLFMHKLCLWYVYENEVVENKKYDAFVSYSHKDANFVMQELLPILEHAPRSYKLCLHVRDWIAGEFISKQIIESINNSRRTLIVLSHNFLESEWGKMEFRTAHKQALQEGRTRIVVILYGDIDIYTDLDDEFKTYIKTNTFIKWGDPLFWNKLRYALPHS